VVYPALENRQLIASMKIPSKGKFFSCL